MKPHLLVMILGAALCCAACHGKDSPTPTGPTPTAPTPTPAAPTTPVVPAPQVTKIAVTGNLSLAAVGETSPLTATASLSDGTTKDVTTVVTWSSSDPASITISPAGIATVVRFGSSFIGAFYASKYAGVSVKATPPGTFVVAGRVRQPGSGPVAGARVVETASGASVRSDAEGDYSIGGLTAAAHLTVEKDGFERVTLNGTPGGYDDVPMQSVIRIAAGAKVTTAIAPHDMDYSPIAGSRCYPCRLIRVTVSDAGVLQFRLAWTETGATLNLWVNGQLFAGTTRGPSEVTADVPVAAGELLVYVGMATPVDNLVPLTLTTAK